MSRIRQILGLNTQGTSKKRISDLITTSRYKAKKYIHKSHKEQLTFEQVNAMNDHDQDLLFGYVVPVSKDQGFEQLQALLSKMEKQLKRKGMTILLLFEQYKRITQWLWQYPILQDAPQ